MTFHDQYADYQRTVFGRTLMATPDGFMVYGIEDRGIYISEVYVTPEARKQGYARDMLAVVEAKARAMGLKYIYGTVDCTTRVWRESVAAQEACGFKAVVQNGNVMLLVKEVGVCCEGM